MKFGLFLFGILFSAQLLAQSNCFVWLKRDAKTFNHQEVYQNDHYEFIKTTRGQNGGKFVLLKLREDKTWMIGKRFHDDNSVAGNPLWFLSIMPPEITAFFGIEIYDQNMQIFKSTSGPRPIYIRIPDVNEINGTLDKLNKLLTAKKLGAIPYRFLVDQGKTSSEVFLKNLHSKNEMPFSQDNYISFHDLNYHFLTFFLISPEMHAQSQLVTGIYLKFVDWLKLAHPEVATKKVIDEVYDLRANQIDRLGNMTVHMQDPYEVRVFRDARDGISDFLGYGNAPYDFFKTTIVFSMLNSLTLHSLAGPLFEEFKKTLGPEFLTANKTIQNFLKIEPDEVPNLRPRILEIRKALREP